MAITVRRISYTTLSTFPVERKQITRRKPKTFGRALTSTLPKRGLGSSHIYETLVRIEFATLSGLTSSVFTFTSRTQVLAFYCSFLNNETSDLGQPILLKLKKNYESF